MSVLKGKAGFVIPKNKFSGSLVPIFKKSENSETATEANGKQQQRKTKWGADLTQDSTVKRGRALAYQTRVDQITQQLKLGSSKRDSQSSESAGDVTNSELGTSQELENLQNLELERREAIGEILKLNPSYKTPPDHQPVVREATVNIPVKAHPGYNFLGLVYGSDGETQKRLEKETGTKIQVCGKMTETGEKVEITHSDGREVLSTCEEAYVRILADTYEKADAAAALIELLLSSVVLKPTSSREPTSVSGDNTPALGEGQEITTAHAISSSMASQDVVWPATGPMLNFSQGLFQPYQVPLFPTGQPIASPAFVPVSGSGPLFNPSSYRPLFEPRPPAPYVYGSPPQSSQAVPPRIHPQTPLMQASLVPPAYSVGQTGPPRSLSGATSSSPLVNNQSSVGGSPSATALQLPERPPTSAINSPGWLVPTSGTPQSLASPAPAVSMTPQFPLPQQGPSPPASFPSAQIRSSSVVPHQAFAPQVQLNSSTNTVLRPAQNVAPPSPSSLVRLFGSASPGHAASFTPLQQTGVTASRPPQQGSYDFFQPQQRQGPPSQSLPGPGLQFASQRPSHPQLPPAPQMPSFRPALHSTIQQSVQQGFPRPPVANVMGPPHGHLRAPNMNSHMGPGNQGQVAHYSNSAGSFPPRPRAVPQFQQSESQPEGMFGVNLSRRPQYYDPLFPSPLPAAQLQGSNTGMIRKQESDPEYEDLMASVGVK